VNVLSTAAPVTLNSAGGGDVVNVGNPTNGVQDIRGTLDVHNGPSRSTLNVNDAANPSLRLVTLNVSGTTGIIAALAPAVITYTTFDVSALNVTSGRGDDFIFVAATAAGVPVTLNSSGGTDAVRVGPQQVQDIRGTLTVRNTGGRTDLEVDDSVTTTPHNVTLAVNGTTGSISGLTPAPATINYATAELSALTVRGGRGANTYTVANTAAGFATTLTTNTFLGQDQTVNVLATTGPLNVLNVATGVNEVIVGNTVDLRGIQGTLTVTSQSGRTDL
jgi:hypothetical protein